jgi:hypothetical protein
MPLTDRDLGVSISNDARDPRELETIPQRSATRSTSTSRRSLHPASVRASKGNEARPRVAHFDAYALGRDIDCEPNRRRLAFRRSVADAVRDELGDKELQVLLRVPR